MLYFHQQLAESGSGKYDQGITGLEHTCPMDVVVIAIRCDIVLAGMISTNDCNPAILLFLKSGRLSIPF
jgi:hypothetical protein